MSAKLNDPWVVVALAAVLVVGTPAGAAGSSSTPALQQECVINSVDIVDSTGAGFPTDEDGDGYASQFGFSIRVDTKCFGAYDDNLIGDPQIEPVMQLYINDVLLGAIRELDAYSADSGEISDDLRMTFAPRAEFLEGNFSRGTLSFRIVLLDNDPPLASLDPISTDTIDEWQGSVNYEPRAEDRPTRTESPSENQPIETETPTETPDRTDVDAHIVEFVPANGSYTTGEEVVSRVEVENGGDEFDTFFVGYGVRGPDGETYDNNGTTGKPISLAPGDVETVSLSWTVEPDAPPGDYGVGTAVWLEADREELSTRLDETDVPDAFTVVSDAENTSQQPTLDVNAETTVRDESVTVDFEVNNTADRRIDGVTLAVDGVPTNWTVMNRSDDGGFWVTANRTWFWRSIEAGDDRSPSATFRLPPNVSVGNWTVIARVTDAAGTNVTTTVRLSPEGIAAPLSVAFIEVENRTVRKGGNTSITLRVGNRNATQATGVTLELRGEVATWQVLSHDETHATWSTSTRTWFWQALPANTTDTVSVTFEVPDNASTDVHVLEARLSDASGRVDVVNVSIQVANASGSGALATAQYLTVAPRASGVLSSGLWAEVGDSYSLALPVSGHGRAVERGR